MATSTIQQPATNIITGDLTRFTWAKSYSPTYTYFKKIGRLVVFQIYMTETIAAGSTFVTGIPSEFIPINNEEWFVGTDIFGVNGAVRVNMQNVGQIIMNSNKDLPTLFVHGSYFS